MPGSNGRGTLFFHNSRNSNLSAGAANAASVGGSPPTKLGVGAIAGIASVLASLGSSIFSFFSNRETNRANQRLTEENNRQNLALWHMNNLYNSPISQRQRLEEAGFNPNLLTGSVASGNSSSSPYSEAAQMQAFQMPDLGSSFGNAFEIYQQSRLQEEQIEAQRLVNEGQDIQNKLSAKDLSNKDREIYNQNRLSDDLHDQAVATVALNQERILETRENIAKIAAERKVSEEQLVSVALENAFNSATFEDRVEQLRLSNNLTRKQISYIVQQTKEVAKRLLLMDSDLRNSNAVFAQMVNAFEKSVGHTQTLDSNGNVIDADIWSGAGGTEKFARAVDYVGLLLGNFLNLIPKFLNKK